VLWHGFFFAALSVGISSQSCHLELVK